MNFRKLLKFLYIIQEVSNRNRNPKLGRGFNNAVRFNPYNPLSYITIIIIFIVGIIMFGLVGFWKEVELINPFKWN
jgi:hypothetical protein